MTVSGAATPRISKLFAGMGDGRPSSEGREIIPDGEEKDSILAYLKAGKMLLRTTARSRDLLDETKGAVVPTTFKTDGVWIWTGATAYYLKTYGMAPEPEFTEYIRSKRYVYVEPTQEQRSAAHAVLEENFSRNRGR